MLRHGGEIFQIAHEHRLHAILEGQARGVGEEIFDQAVAFITQATREQQKWIDDLPTRIADPGLVALLVGKASVASERGITFSVSSRVHSVTLPTDPVAADLPSRPIPGYCGKD